jgi:hypothetical protein
VVVVGWKIVMMLIVLLVVVVAASTESKVQSAIGIVKIFGAGPTVKTE